MRELSMLNYSNCKISHLENQSWGGRALCIILPSKCKKSEVGEPFKIKSGYAPNKSDDLMKLADEIAASSMKNNALWNIKQLNIIKTDRYIAKSDDLKLNLGLFYN